MTPERLKAENPSLYQSIFNQGVSEERKRVEGWLNSETQNKWQLRDGVKSGKSVNDNSQSEVENFYGTIDSKLKGKKPQGTRLQDEVENDRAPDNFQEMEANEFYTGIDKMLQR